MIVGFAPISRSINFWPSFFGDTPEWLDKVGFIDYEIYEIDSARTVSGQLAILTRIAFPLFGIPGLELAFLNSGGMTVVDFNATTYPGFGLSLSNLNVSLFVKNNWLIPVELNTSGEWVPIMEGGEQKAFAVTLGGVSINYVLPDSLEFDTSNLNATIDTIELGNTGIVLEMTGITPYLSSQQVHPPGHPHFKGVGIENISIHLPFEFDETNSTGVFIGENIYIGNTGFSGRLLLTSSGGQSPLLKLTLSNFNVSLTCFSLTFLQNSITNSEICGTMEIPGFTDGDGNPAEIEIDVHFDENGNFSITASETQGVQVLAIPNILRLNLKSLTLGKRDDRFYVAVSGNLDFDQKSGAIGQVLPKDVEITKLLIWSDGSWEFEGGALVMPTSFTLPLGPVKLSITALHIGSDERNGLKYKYVGFDGGISINPGGVDARGDGIKYYFSDDGTDFFFRIEGIGIDLILPGNVSEDKAALILSGYLAVREGGEYGVEYAGSVAFALPKLNISGSAGMRYIPQEPAFLVDVGLELANPIPIGSTGMGIYGFEALFGRHFVVSKEEAGMSADSPWYEYFKKPERGINPPKFYPIGGTSLGAGALLGTSGDSGFTHSGRLFFLLSLPGMFLLEGEAQILKKRTGFASPNTPPFYAFIMITDSSIEAALGVDYKMPASGSTKGDIAEVTGALELGFFFGNSNGWYLNIGRDLPETKRVNAKLLRIINRAYFYLMLSASGIRTGAGAGLDFDKKFGPARVKVKAYLDLAARISVHPLQIGGSIQAGIEGSVKIFGVGVGISAHFGLSVDAPKPFIISGEVRVCVRIIIKKCANVPFKWEFNSDLNVVEIPLLEADSVNAMNVHTGETFPVEFDTGSFSAVIPMDSFVDIEFKRAVNPLETTELIGGVAETPKYKELLPPKKARAPQLTYEFNVVSVELLPNDVFNIPGAEVPDGAKIGFWQWNAPGHYTKIRLLSLSPLSFMSSGVPNGPSWSSDYAITNMDCVDTLIEETCIEIGAIGVNGLLPSETLVTSQGIGFQLSSGPAGIVGSSLRFSGGQTLTLYFAEATSSVNFGLLTETDQLIVKFYQRVADDNLVYSDILVTTEEIAGPINAASLNYDDPTTPIQKIVIETGSCNLDSGSGGSVTPDDLPCSEQIMADLVGLLNGLHKAGQDILDNPLDVTNNTWVPRLYKYLLGDTFHLCTKFRDCSGNGSLLERLLTFLPPVTVEYLEFDNFYGQYEINIEDCAKFTVKFFLPSTYQNQVICFECLKMIDDITDGELNFSGEAVLNDGSRIPFSGCITTDISGSGYGEPEACFSELLRLCYMTLETYQYNELVTATNNVNNAGDDINILSSSVGQVIWQPETDYMVKIKTKTNVYKDGGTTPYAFFDEMHEVTFRTEGPPGFFHQYPNNGAFHPQYAELLPELKDKFKLRTLLHYIDFATSYPNADGNLINSKPIFYENVELGLYFTQPYIRTMYDGGAGGFQLGLKIKDPAKPAQDSEASYGEWVPGPVIENAENIAINEILGEVECLSVNTVQTLSQGSIFNKNLEPLKCYTAIFNALKGDEEREVHRYVFETSRYATFAEMVDSYQLKDEEGLMTEAAFVAEGSWGNVNIPAADSEDVLAYERVVFGTLGLSDLPPATTTEFLMLRDGGGSIVAVLVRNPEPFNDPKMPGATLQDGIDLKVNGVSLETKIVSKDSSAILFPGGGNWPGNDEITIAAIFRYKQYNPDSGQYEDAETIDISFTKQF